MSIPNRLVCSACQKPMDFKPDEAQDGTQQETCEWCGAVNFVHWSIDRSGRWHASLKEASIHGLR